MSALVAVRGLSGDLLLQTALRWNEYELLAANGLELGVLLYGTPLL